MLLSATAIGAVTEVLEASDFYRESHGTIYKAALALYGKGEPVDAITLANELDERSELERVGGTAKIAELAAVVPATSNAEHYARIVKEMATLRGLVRVGQEIQRLGQTRPGETTDLVDRAEQMVFDLAQQRVTGDFAHIHDLLNESFARIMHLYEAGVDVTGIAVRLPRARQAHVRASSPATSSSSRLARRWGSRRSPSAWRPTSASATRRRSRSSRSRCRRPR